MGEHEWQIAVGFEHSLSWSAGEQTVRKRASDHRSAETVSLLIAEFVVVVAAAGRMPSVRVVVANL